MNADVITALADPTRRRILELVAARAQSASSLARELPVTRAAVLKHLAVLDRSGLVTSRRAGREVRFDVRTDPLRDTAAWLSGLADAWDGRLDRLRRLAEEG